MTVAASPDAGTAPRLARRATRVARWTLFALLLAGFVLLPFVLLDARMAALAEGALHAGRSAGYVTLVVVGLLLVDIVLPIPSSFVLATAGYLLGAGFGALACFVGLSCASAAGYALGRLAGEVAARRIVGAPELDRLRAWARTHGDLLIVALRAVPVLAEATVLLAGTARMPVARFAVLVSVGNLVVAALYAGIGAASASQQTFAGVSIAAMALPVLLVLLSRRFMSGGAGGAARP
jgi:uncharacterized membrane protein YdjX (TVP38/TMEM64 family)